MSNQGTGTVVFVPGAVLLVVGDAVVGTGILIGKGIMWCHDKMEENYREACKSYSALRERAEAELLSRPADRSLIIAETLDRNMSALNLALGDDTVQQHAPQANPELLSLLRKAQEAVNTQAVRPGDYEQGKERRRLEIAIAVATGALPDSAALDAARRALAGTTQDMLTARQRLDAAWNQVANDKAQQRRHERQVELMTAETRRKLAVTEAFAQQQNIALGQQMAHKIAEARERLRAAQQILPHNGAEAERAAEAAAKIADEVVYGVATEVERLQDEHRGRGAVARGQLRALDDLITDVERGKLAPDEVTADMRRRVTQLRARCDAIAGEGATGASSDGIAALMDQIDALKAGVFALVTPRQQRQIGVAIAETLSELGFEPVDDHNRLAPTANGDSLTIAARRLENPVDAASDDHFVYFTVDKQGRVGYHFDGYRDDACTREADRVFKALRKRGVLISTRAKVSALDCQADASALPLDQLAPDLSVNSQQALRKQALLDVLRRLGHTHIDQRISGGVYEIDAHNGVGHTLHTEIEPTGEFAVHEYGESAPGAGPEVVEDALSRIELAPDLDDEYERPKGYTHYDSGRVAQSS